MERRNRANSVERVNVNVISLDSIAPMCRIQDGHTCARLYFHYRRESPQDCNDVRCDMVIQSMEDIRFGEIPGFRLSYTMCRFSVRLDHGTLEEDLHEDHAD